VFKKSTISLAILIFLLFAISTTLLKVNKSQNVPVDITNTPQAKPFTDSYSITPKSTFNPNPHLDSEDYTVEWIIIRDPKKLELYQNLEDQLSSSDAYKKYACSQLISGSFYSQENKNLGLLIADEKLLEKAIKSQLFNAFFYITKDGLFDISVIQPVESDLRIAVQSGPLLIKNSSPQVLNIESDENARRVVVATTQKGEIAFLVLYYKPSPLIGPKLEELPNLLNQIQTTTNLKFKNALNLDGGSHSAFITQNVKVSEVATVGTFFCIKP
jgi:exopolysaccharide biosynthesis protein